MEFFELLVDGNMSIRSISVLKWLLKLFPLDGYLLHKVRQETFYLKFLQEQ